MVRADTLADTIDCKIQSLLRYSVCKLCFRLLSFLLKLHYFITYYDYKTCCLHPELSVSEIFKASDLLVAVHSTLSLFPCILVIIANVVFLNLTQLIISLTGL